MSLLDEHVLISADDHLDIHAMPPDVWSSGLPTAWRERGPRVEETPDGPYWFCDGQRVSPSGRKETGFIAAHDHGFRPGQPRTRLEDMDRDGVRASVIYGPTCTQLQINDAALHEQVARVYNAWAADFQREAPDRLVLLPDVPSYDPQVAKRELERCAKLGHKGAIVSNTVGRGKPGDAARASREITRMVLDGWRAAPAARGDVVRDLEAPDPRAVRARADHP